MSYSFCMPSTNLMGRDSLALGATKIAEFGFKKALVVTDKPLVDNGVVAQVLAKLAEHGIEAAVFDGVLPNPTVTNVEDGLKMLVEHDAECVISVGGGSPIDCAKGIALVHKNGGSIKDYKGVNLSKFPQTPLIAINTTAGTGSEMTQFCIITDEEKHIKMAIVDKNTIPVLSINDPVLMLGKPAGLTAATGMDALTHAVEAYVSTAATPVTDACAEKAIELIFEFLPSVVRNGSDLDGREQMAYAAFLAGCAFNNASLGIVHATAHQLGGFYNIPHGIANAVLLPACTEFNLSSESASKKLARAAKVAGLEVDHLTEEAAAKAFVSAIRVLSKEVGITQNLTDLGVKEEDLDILATNALDDACLITNPIQPTKEEVKEIIRSLLG